MNFIKSTLWPYFPFKNDYDMIVAIAATYIRLGFTSECESYFAEKGIELSELR